MQEKVEFERALILRIIAILGRKEEMAFDDVVRQYRQIEAEFIARAGDDEILIIDTKRSINIHLLMEAEIHEWPYGFCREIWEELVRLEFWNIEMRHVLGGRYARCCLFNSEFDAGLAVLEPLIAELETLLAQTALTADNRAFCTQFLEMHSDTRDQLRAGLREPPDSSPPAPSR